MEIVDYLNNTVYCKLGASPIHNIGVFAIRDIPADQKITDYVPNKPYAQYALTEEEFALLAPEVQALIQQQTIFPNGRLLYFDSPNCHQVLECFMNHSDTPNSNGIRTLREIKKGEELTKNYNVFINSTHPKTKDIFKV
jgi:SET domain-containing protein